ncbi:MAG: sigma-70 family RNA polymerase sigma factor [Oscillospiraceae bacterium]|nr:sigma-70 family RNA polymerase sigma factor [Oscillospiraceae bacterium]
MKEVPFELVSDYISSPQAGVSNSTKIEHARQVIRQAIKADLSPRQKQIVCLYYSDGLNTVQIARELGLNKSTVSRTLKRGINNLQKHLKYIRLR